MALPPDQPEREQPADPMIGRTVAGKFRIDAFVGRGAMGAVYRATQLNLKKKIAIKVMNPDRPADGAYAHRFKREAKAASRMDHPNSLRVIDFGEDEGLLYIAMEFLEGRDLLQVLRDEWPLSKERIVNILSQTLAALAVAHEMGVIHRDLKPENIMLLPSKDDEGNPTEVVKVCDFGIAKIVQPDPDPVGDAEGLGKAATHTGTLTAHGMLIGTPEYMSPEQARGEPADARSDIYSLGVILFQLLTGRLPFVATSKIRLVIKHVEEVPTPPHEIDSQVDLRLEAICMKALAKRQEDRYQTAREMRADLRAALEGGPSVQLRAAASTSSPPPPAAKRESTAKVNATRTASDAMKSAETKRASDPPAPAERPSNRPRAMPDFDQLMPSASTIDPVEASRAIAEARKRLSNPPSGPPPVSTPPPPSSTGGLTSNPPAAPAQPGQSRLLVGVIIVLSIALVVVLAYALRR